MTINPDLARERIRFLLARIEDAPDMRRAVTCVDEMWWWKRQLAEHRND